MADPVQQNLAGLRVLDITQYIAGPTLGRILADLGAEVVKLEMPPGGEYSRRGGFPPRVDGQSPAYIYYNRGKRSICIDFKRPEGAAIVVELARHFDIVIENYTPGVLAKYGLTYDAFKAINPRIIMCSISGFGQTGSRVNLPGNDMTAQALSGLLHLTGTEDGTPVYPGMYLADGGGGVNGVAAVLAALYYRERSGIGQYIDVALYECVFHLHDVFLMQNLFTYGDYNPGPTGRHRPRYALRSVSDPRWLDCIHRAESPVGTLHQGHRQTRTDDGRALQSLFRPLGQPPLARTDHRRMVPVAWQP